MNIRVKLTKQENARSHGSSKGSVVSIEMETYLKGVVGTEAYSTWRPEALKAQAVAARTYALYHMQNRSSKEYDVTDNTTYQSYNYSKISIASTAAAVVATTGIVITYNRKAICSEYAASNGGYSNSAGKPYYRSGYDGYTVRAGRTTKHGHDRGMSQWGMQQAAVEGLSFQQILSYYYPHTQLTAAYNSNGNPSSPSVNTTPVSNKGRQIVELARAQIGKPYVLGSDGPNSFDCSGLAVYCYRQFGITLPHGSTSIHKQYSNNIVWTPSNTANPWAAGDLVFLANKTSDTWSVENYTTHVGIATGYNKMVIEARGVNSGILEADWSARTTLHSVVRILDSSETGVTGPGSSSGSTLPTPTAPPIVNVSDIISGITDNLKDVIDSIIASKDKLGYVEKDDRDNAVVYGYLIDLKNSGEFKFILPDYSMSTTANYESTTILGRSSPVKSYESTSENSVSIKVTLAAGTGVYGQTDGSMDPIDKMESDIRFVRSLLYPDYSKSVLLPPANIVLILGNSIRIRGIVTSVNVDYQRPFDSKGRYMIANLDFTVVEVPAYPADYSDVRKRVGVL